MYLPELSFLNRFLALLVEVSPPALAESEAPVSIHSVQVKHGSPWADKQDNSSYKGNKTLGYMPLRLKTILSR